MTTGSASTDDGKRQTLSPGSLTKDIEGMTTTTDRPAHERVVSVLSVLRRHVDLQRVSSALCC